MSSIFGKNVEILPNDDGLRKLAKISEGYGDYNGHEIDDVQFVRQNQNVNEVVDQLGSRIPAAAEKAEQAINEVAAAEERIGLQRQAAKDDVIVDNSQNVIPDELGDLNQLQEKLQEVKTAVEAKTKAFYDEGVVVGQAVGKEIAALKQLEAVVDEITAK